MATSGGTVGTPIGGGLALGDRGPGLDETLLGHARYAQIMQIGAPHFHQMAGALAPLGGGCDDVWDQDDREALVWAIGQAEAMIAEELGFWPAPKYFVDEEVRVARVRPDWWNAELRTKWGHVQAFGAEELTLVLADALVLYEDRDSDPLGREELGRVTSALYQDLAACDAACEAAMFFRSDDGAWDDADPRFEVRPLAVDVDGSTMSLEAESSQFVFPALWELTRADCEGSDDEAAWKHDFGTGNLVSYVDVYCRTTDAQTPITLCWDGVCQCTSPCAHATQTACPHVTNWERGHFAARPATWNGATHVDAAPLYWTAPQKLRVSYLAGYPRDPVTCRMDRRLERAIVKLANALLPEPPCGWCDPARRLWELDRSPVDPLTPEAASMPWDVYSRGALEAWRIVKRFGGGRSMGGGSVRGSF